MPFPAPLIRTIYNAVLLPLAGAAFFIGKLFSKRLAARVHGVRRTWATLEALPAGEPRIWFHAASMGEFEQAKSIIERLKELMPDVQIIVSFFSPSGYEHQKNYKYADAVVYLPLDTPANARRFVELLAPDAVVVVRYDLWHNHLAELHRRSVPTMLICATINSDSALLSSAFIEFTRRSYSFFTTIYTAGESETQRFREHYLATDAQLITAVDTRFDRIAAQVEAARKQPVLPPDLFAPQDVVLVAGSSWEEDEDMLLQARDHLDESARLRLRLIIVPHQPGAETVNRLLALLPDAQRLSDIENTLATGKRPVFRHIIVDSVGKLLRLYSHAHCAYVGGGFRAGVHSVTEPAGYGIPLACGPKISRARDAIALHELGALNIIEHKHDAREWLSAMVDSPSIREKRGSTARNYVHTDVGYSDVIAQRIIGEIQKPLDSR